MGEVCLVVPARAEFLHVVRAVVSGMAARQGLSYDALDDLCLAANEAAAYLLALPTTGEASRRLTVRLRGRGKMELAVMTDAPVLRWPPATPRPMAWKVLSALVDEVSFELEDSFPSIRLMMLSQSQAEQPSEAS
jgi:hypothetical protein